MTIQIRPEIEGLKDTIISTRRDIHQHPELAFDEHRTSKLVANRLESMGIDVQTGVGKTGVVGTLKGGNDGKTIALRADMDALPMQETSDVSYKSKNDGIMHACGHDGHTAMLLGTAEALSKKAEKLNGTVKFFFQPAEEGQGGAKYMIEDGALTNVDEVYGIHLWNYQKYGTIGVMVILFAGQIMFLQKTLMSKLKEVEDITIQLINRWNKSDEKAERRHERSVIEMNQITDDLNFLKGRINGGQRG